MISIPLQIYVISQQAFTPHTPFNWALIHDPEAWKVIEPLPSDGRIAYTRYIWLVSAFMVFVFFGFGRDASRMYAKGLREIGLDKCFPCLRNHRLPVRNTSQSGTINSASSKAKLLFGRKSSSASPSVKSWATDSRSSKATASSMAEPLSPRTLKNLETVQESYRAPTAPAPAVGAFQSRAPGWLTTRDGVVADIEKNLPATPKQSKSGFHRLTSPFWSATASNDSAVPMNNIMRTQEVVVQTSLARDRV
jgi:hypothetical protein